MYNDTLTTLSDQAAAKLHAQQSIPSHLIRSAFAGMYVGISILLILTIGGSLSAAAPAAVRLLMGICFGGALTFVIFAGSELFTGSNLVLTVAVLSKRARLQQLLANWIWTWIGNLLGSLLIAFLAVRSGLLDADPIKSFILAFVEKKMHIPPDQLIIRAILANWLVCLAVWMCARTRSDTSKILLIWWCMFTFITCGFEHSVANMTGLMIGLLLPHGPAITPAAYAYNLSLATLGNILGGALFIALLYHLASRPPRPSPIPATISQPTLTPEPTA
jgi:nitrite transporter NirC